MEFVWGFIVAIVLVAVIEVLFRKFVGTVEAKAKADADALRASAIKEINKI